MAPDDRESRDSNRRLAELDERLREARRQRGEDRQVESPPSKLGIAFRLVTELLAGVIVGGGIGWALDWYFGTSPFLLILMFLVGAAAGVVNVVRAARQMDEDQSRANRG